MKQGSIFFGLLCVAMLLMVGCVGTPEYISVPARNPMTGVTLMYHQQDSANYCLAACVQMIQEYESWPYELQSTIMRWADTDFSGRLSLDEASYYLSWYCQIPMVNWYITQPTDYKYVADHLSVMVDCGQTVVLPINIDHATLLFGYGYDSYGEVVRLAIFDPAGPYDAANREYAFIMKPEEVIPMMNNTFLPGTATPAKYGIGQNYYPSGGVTTPFVIDGGPNSFSKNRPDLPTVRDWPPRDMLPPIGNSFRDTICFYADSVLRAGTEDMQVVEAYLDQFEGYYWGEIIPSSYDHWDPNFPKVATVPDYQTYIVEMRTHDPSHFDELIGAVLLEYDDPREMRVVTLLPFSPESQTQPKAVSAKGWDGDIVSLGKQMGRSTGAFEAFHSEAFTEPAMPLHSLPLFRKVNERGEEVIVNYFGYQCLREDGKIVQTTKGLTADELYGAKSSTAENSGLPDQFGLQNFPNPFNPETRISFSLSAPAEVTLVVYNTLGQQVALLIDTQVVPAGNHEALFDASASKLSSGIYFARLSVGNNVSTAKMVLMK